MELKKKYSGFQKLVENSGFGWDEDNQLPTADPSVWDKYLEKHPEAKEFRNKTLPHYQSLHELFSGSVATGALKKMHLEFLPAMTVVDHLVVQQKRNYKDLVQLQWINKTVMLSMFSKVLHFDLLHL